MTVLERFVRDRLEDDAETIARSGPDVHPWSRQRFESHLRAGQALLEDITAEKHLVVDSDCWYTCNAATEERDGGENCNDNEIPGCHCGRDARVERRLKVMARAWPDHPEFDPTWRTQ